MCGQGSLMANLVLGMVLLHRRSELFTLVNIRIISAYTLYL